MLTLGVTDLILCSDFYENKFGWKRSPMSQGNMIAFELDGIILALFPRKRIG